MPPQIFLRCRQREGLLIVKSLAHEVIEELRALIPPVAEQFRVIRREHQRRAIQNAAEVLDLADSGVEKMSRVFTGGMQRCTAVIDFFLTCTCDAKIFYSGKSAMVWRRQMRPHIIEFEIKPDVAIEVPITVVAGIAFVLAPDLAR